MHRVSLALALALVVMLAPAMVFAEGAHASGSVEVGGISQNIDDSAQRVDEYSTTGKDSGVEYYHKVKVDVEQDGYLFDAEINGTGSDNQDFSLELDAKRIFRLDSEYSKLNHRLDNDQMQYLDASIPSGKAAKVALDGLGYNYTGDANAHHYELPGVDDIEAAFGDWFNPDQVPGYIGYQASTGKYFAAIPKDPDFKPTTDPDGNGDVAWQQVGRAGLYGENFLMDADFFVERREWKNHVDITLPNMPNVTLHAGYRVEDRKGWEQSITMSKCTACHITGSSKDIDEETRDLTLGATGKFGLVTLDYEYLNREFEVNADDPTKRYNTTYKPNPNSDYDANGGVGIFNGRTLYNYADGELPYDTTPESEKDSHVLKARVDLSNDTTLIGSFVTSEVESSKQDEPGMWTIGDKTISIDYDAYGLRAATRLGALKLNARFKAEEVKTDDKQLSFVTVYTDAVGNQGATGKLGVPEASYDYVYGSPANKDVMTLGLDGSYRLGRYTTARLGYEYEDVDRELDEYGDTETHTVKASLNTRANKQLKGRISYEYQNISEPFMNPDAALIEVAGVNDFLQGPIPEIGLQVGNGASYGTMFYDLRQADLTNQPEDIHESKMSLTWSPSVRFATTFTFRYKAEENSLDRSSWEQNTLSPGVSMWYAPNEKTNISLAYNYFDQRSKTAFCQGYYDG